MEIHVFFMIFDSRVFRRKMGSRVIAIGQMAAKENPTCIARLVQFKVVAVATQPRLHLI